jgi:hypothetical protein
MVGRVDLGRPAELRARARRVEMVPLKRKIAGNVHNSGMKIELFEGTRR